MPEVGNYLAPDLAVCDAQMAGAVSRILCLLLGGSQKRCTKGGDRVRGCITHLLSIKNSNVDGFHVSVVINI